MKRALFLLSASLLLISLSSFKNDPGGEPGRSITDAFKVDYPLVKSVKWESQKNVYVAKFENVNNNKAQLAYYAEDGKFLGQMWRVQLDEVSSVVKIAILKDADISGVKSVFLFFSPEWEQKYYATIIKNGKQVIKEINLQGESSIVRKKRIPTI